MFRFVKGRKFWVKNTVILNYDRISIWNKI